MRQKNFLTWRLNMICYDLASKYCKNNECGHLSDCVNSHDSRSIIKCIENRKQYSLINDLKLNIINFHLDGAVIKSSTQKKCDYIVLPTNANNNVVILVELKGSCYNTAISQIYETIRLYDKNFVGNKIYARIICGGVPNIQNTPCVLQLKRELLKSGGNLVSKTISLEEKLSKLV